MIQRCTKEDADFIDMVSTNSENWDKVKDDNCPPKEKFSVADIIDNEDLYFLKAIDDNRPVGYFLFIPENEKTCECHVCFLPKQREHSVELAKEAVEWMFENTEYPKLVVRIMAGNVAVRKICEECRVRDGRYTRRIIP